MRDCCSLWILHVLTCVVKVGLLYPCAKHLLLLGGYSKLAAEIPAARLVSKAVTKAMTDNVRNGDHLSDTDRRPKVEHGLQNPADFGAFQQCSRPHHEPSDPFKST